MSHSTAGQPTPRVEPGHTTDRPALSIAPGHIPALDGVRGLAILLILVYHFTLGMTGRGLAARLLIKGTSAGWCGVDLFFVLSGFLITGILHDARGAPHRFRNFYARRALRIFPLYYGCLAVLFAALPWIAARVGGFEGVEGAWIWLALYGTNGLVAIRDGWFPLAHFWSLAVEEHFYLFWPAVVIYCGRGTAMRVCVVMVVLAMAVRLWLVSRNLVLAAYCLTVCRMDALAIGSLLALALRGPGGVATVAPVARKVALGSAVALVCLVGWRFGLTFHDPAVQVLGFLVLALFFAAMLALVVASPSVGVVAAPFRLPPLRWLGRYSYGLYVYNSIFILAADGLALHSKLVAWTGSAIGRLLYIAIAVVSTVGTSWLSWHLFEKHFLGLKRFFPGPTRRDGEPPRQPRDGTKSPRGRWLGPGALVVGRESRRDAGRVRPGLAWLNRGE